MRKQSTSTLLMVRPRNFGFNEETAENNSFQRKGDEYNPESVQQKALLEFDAFVATLREHGIEVLVVDDTETPIKTDAIFPNNWFSTHQEGVLMVYPMFAESRRLEVREDIIDNLSETYGYDEVIDWTPTIYQNAFLEGTGSLILDRVNKIAYACYSPRSNKTLFKEWGKRSGYKTFGFHSVDQQGMPIYHTNVMMAMGTNYVIISMESISDPEEKQMLTEAFQSTNKEVIDLSLNQVNQFAGNMLEVTNLDEQLYLIMSQAAYNSLNEAQLTQINKYAKPLVAAIPTIEQYGGGSVRCMLAEIFKPIVEV